MHSGLKQAVDLLTDLEHWADAATPRQVIKGMVRWARDEHPGLDFVGQIDQEDIIIEALIHPELFEVQIKAVK